MIQLDKHLPIGLFDSGVGGLTVLREISKELPYEDVIYLGDTARVPYGPKNPQDVKQYVLEISRYLEDEGCKLIVIACNTGTAVGLEAASSVLNIPVMGVIEPGCEIAVKTTANGKIGVIGTIGTINSKAYEDTINRIDKEIEVISYPCSRFVDFIEAGIIDGDEIYSEVEKSLMPLIEAKVDTLILGCTHYPLIEHIINDVMGNDVEIISSAKATAIELKKILHPLFSENESRYEYIATADPENFKLLGSRFLGKKIKNVNHLPLEILSKPSLSRGIALS